MALGEGQRTSSDPGALELEARGGSIDSTSTQRGMFPFDAFEFDDPEKEENPVIRVREPWVFQVGSGGGAFFTGPLEITESVTLTADVNWMTIGPITIADGVVVIVEGNWVIV